MTLTKKIRETIADHFFAEELDLSFNIGVREGYRNGSGDARRHYFNLLQTQLQSLYDSADAKHKHGLGVAVAYMETLNSELNTQEKGVQHGKV
jgi:hypothetical protein